ncbi:MAG: hypothetical protein KDA21_14430, partial [Phycisphaerales bacterium]|nr:hypothetical protein [Phycisphaerales bacterium]
MTLTGSEFTTNRADSGGAVAIATGVLQAGTGGGTVVATIDGCGFHDNHAGSGGAIIASDFATSGARVNISQCSLDGNLADYRGGALHAEDINIDLESTTIESNAVEFIDFAQRGGSPSGGALYVFRGSTSIRECVIRDNHISVVTRGFGTRGGGIAADEAELELIDTLVQGNSADIGGGLWLGEEGGAERGSVAAFLDRTTIRGNQAGTGGGIFLSFGELELRDVTIEANGAEDPMAGVQRGFSQVGGGIYAEGAYIAGANVTIRGNRAGALPTTGRGFSSGSGGGIFMVDSDLEVDNALIVVNYAENAGGGVYAFDDFNGGFLSLTNATIADNTALSSGGGLFSDRLEFEILNGIVYGNSADGDMDQDAQIQLSGFTSRGSDFQVRNTLIQSLQPGGDFDQDENFDGNPDFVNPGIGIYNLGTASDARDAGDAALLNSDSFDLDDDMDIDEDTPFDRLGLTRVVGADVDCGALEYQGPPRLYVDAAATGVETGESWSDAYLTLNQATDNAMPLVTYEIWVAEGDYAPTDAMDNQATFAMTDGVTMLGGFPAGGGDGTIDARDPAAFLTSLIAGPGGTSHIVTVGPGVTTFIDGFRITGGSATTGDDLDASGGGMLVNEGNATVEHCAFNDNLAENGAAIYVRNGVLTLRDCAFVENLAYVYGGALMSEGGRMTLERCDLDDNLAFLGGGAIVNRGIATLINSLVRNNQADFYGGAILNNTDAPEGLSLLNCTMVNNRAFRCGGLYNLGGTASAANTILATNNDSDGQEETSQVTIVGGTVNADFCLIQGYSALGGTGNLDGDPMLDADATPLPGSAAINAGDDTLVPAGVTTDFYGNQRFVETVDIGAVEAAETTACPGDANGDRTVNFADLEI